MSVKDGQSLDGLGKLMFQTSQGITDPEMFNLDRLKAQHITPDGTVEVVGLIDTLLAARRITMSQCRDFPNPFAIDLVAAAYGAISGIYQILTDAGFPRENLDSVIPVRQEIIPDESMWVTFATAVALEE